MKEEIFWPIIVPHVCSFDYFLNFITETRGRWALSKLLPMEVNPGDFYAVKFVFKVRLCQVGAEFPFNI